MENQVVHFTSKGHLLEPEKSDELYFFLIIFPSNYSYFISLLTLPFVWEFPGYVYLHFCCMCYIHKLTTRYHSVLFQAGIWQGQGQYGADAVIFKSHILLGDGSYWFIQSFVLWEGRGRDCCLISKSPQGPCGVAELHTTQWAEPEPELLRWMGNMWE